MSTNKQHSLSGVSLGAEYEVFALAFGVALVHRKHLRLMSDIDARHFGVEIVGLGGLGGCLGQREGARVLP